MQAGNVTRYPAAAVGTIPGTDAGGESVLLHLAVRGGFPDAEQLRGGYPAAAVPAHRAAAGTATAAPTPPTPHSSPLRVLASETREIASATLFILYSRYSAEITSKDAPSAIYETGSSLLAEILKEDASGFRCYTAEDDRITCAATAHTIRRRSPRGVACRFCAASAAARAACSSPACRAWRAACRRQQACVNRSISGIRSAPQREQTASLRKRA